MKSVFLCILLNESYCLKAKLMETKFIYRVMHACIEFKLKISDGKKSFSCFVWQPKLNNQAQATDRGKHWKKGSKLPLF